MTARLALLTAAALLWGCGGGASAPPAPATDGATTTYDTSRIVTLGGPVTELAYALGLGEHVVGTDQSSLFPESIQQKPRVGYWRATSAEGLLSLQPTLVLSLEGLGPPAVAGQLEAAGVPVVLVPEAQTMAEAEARVVQVARVLGRADSARAINARTRTALARAEALRPAVAPRVLFVYARGAGLVSVFGRGTAAETVLALAGAENAVTAFDGMRPLTAEAVAEAAPDALVIPARSLASLGGVDGLLAQPGLAQTPAGRDRRVIAVDDALLLGLGPRVALGVEALAHGLSVETAAR